MNPSQSISAKGNLGFVNALLVLLIVWGAFLVIMYPISYLLRHEIKAGQVWVAEAMPAFGHMCYDSPKHYVYVIKVSDNKVKTICSIAGLESRHFIQDDDVFRLGTSFLKANVTQAEWERDYLTHDTR